VVWAWPLKHGDGARTSSGLCAALRFWRSTATPRTAKCELELSAPVTNGAAPASGVGDLPLSGWALLRSPAAQTNSILISDPKTFGLLTNHNARLLARLG
jgi:hypothetical protein